MKSILINRVNRPCAKICVNMSVLPLHWMANKKAWMTAGLFGSTIFSFLKHKDNMEDKSLPFRILLILDNASGHLALEHKNVEIFFLLYNTTAFIQPQDKVLLPHLTGQKSFGELTIEHVSELTAYEVLREKEILENVLYEYNHHLGKKLR